MAHARQTLRTELETRLGTIVGLTVLTDTTEEQSVDDLPAASVWIETDDVTSVDSGDDPGADPDDVVYMRMATFTISVRATTLASLEDTNEQVEIKMAPRDAGWRGVEMLGTVFEDRNVEGDELFASAVRYAIGYETTAKAPGTVRSH